LIYLLALDSLAVPGLLANANSLNILGLLADEDSLNAFDHLIITAFSH